MSILRTQKVKAIEFSGSWGVEFTTAPTGNEILDIHCSLQAIREDEGIITKIRHEGKDYQNDFTMFCDLSVPLLLPSKSETFHKIVDSEGIVYQITKQERRSNGIVPHAEYTLVQEVTND